MAQPADTADVDFTRFRELMASAERRLKDGEPLAAVLNELAATVTVPDETIDFGVALNVIPFPGPPPPAKNVTAPHPVQLPHDQRNSDSRIALAERRIAQLEMGTMARRAQSAALARRLNGHRTMMNRLHDATEALQRQVAELSAAQKPAAADSIMMQTIRLFMTDMERHLKLLHARAESPVISTLIAEIGAIHQRLDAMGSAGDHAASGGDRDDPAP